MHDDCYTVWPCNMHSGEQRWAPFLHFNYQGVCDLAEAQKHQGDRLGGDINWKAEEEEYYIKARHTVQLIYILRKYSLHFKYKSEKKIDGLDF